MKATEKNGYFGERVFSGNAIKYFAALLMVCDHLHEFFFPDVIWLNMLGRLVLPIFIFMVAEGFCHTRSRLKYLLQLLIGFWVMNTLNVAISLQFPIDNPDAPALANNVFSTMFMTAFLILCVDMISTGAKEKKTGKIFGGIGLILAVLLVSVGLLATMFIENMPSILFMITSYVPNLITVEGTFTIVIIGVLFYLFRKHRWLQMLILVAYSAYLLYGTITSGVESIQWMMGFAAIPLFMYNGKRGRGGKFNKWFFYIFYPVHIYAMYFILYFMQRG